MKIALDNREYLYKNVLVNYRFKRKNKTLCRIFFRHNAIYCNRTDAIMIEKLLLVC